MVGGEELLDGVGVVALLPGDPDRGRVVVDADGAGRQDLEVAAEPAADIEGPSQLLTSEPPAVRRLHVEQSFPTGAGQCAQPRGVLLVLGAHRGILSGCRPR